MEYYCNGGVLKYASGNLTPIKLLHIHREGEGEGERERERAL